MKSTFKTETNLFGTIKSYDYSCEFNFSDHQNKLALFDIFSTFTQGLINNKNILKNQKGLDSSFLENNCRLSSNLTKIDNEIFAYQVQIQKAESEIKIANFHIQTPFSSYQGSEITHSILIKSDPETILDFESPLINKTIELVCFRFGIDLYGMNSFANWFLKTPVVIEKFMIEVAEGNARIILQSESSIQKSQVLEVISDPIRSIEKLLKVEIIKDILKIG